FFFVLHGRIKNCHFFIIREMGGISPFLLCYLVLYAYIGKSPAHHNLMISPPGTVRVKQPALYPMFLQVLSGRSVFAKVAGGRNMIGGYRISSFYEYPCSLDILRFFRFFRQILEKRYLSDISRILIPLVIFSRWSFQALPLFFPFMDYVIIIFNVL